MKYKSIFILALTFAPYFLFGSIGPEWCNEKCGWLDLVRMFNGIINYLLTIATILAVISFIYAGFLLITAGGDTGKVGQAKSIFTSVVIGIIFAYGAWIIVHFVFAALGGDPKFSLL